MSFWDKLFYLSLHLLVMALSKYIEKNSHKEKEHTQ